MIIFEEVIVITESFESECGDPAGQATAASVTTGFDDADVLFAQSMIPHHEQAIEMADLALDPASGASTAVRELATRIKAAQDPEIATLRAWLKLPCESSSRPPCLC